VYFILVDQEKGIIITPDIRFQDNVDPLLVDPFIEPSICLAASFDSFLEYGLLCFFSGCPLKTKKGGGLVPSAATVTTMVQRFASLPESRAHTLCAFFCATIHFYFDSK
jgi:hypothetical protein